MKAKKFAADEVAEGVRINKYLADAGVCSRRAADGFIEEGKVFIDGERAVMGSRVLPGQTVVFNGKELKKEEDLVLLALNKPRGIVCTSDKREPDNVVDFVNYGKRIYPIGRLDKDSEGYQYGSASEGNLYLDQKRGELLDRLYVYLIHGDRVLNVP